MRASSRRTTIDRAASQIVVVGLAFVGVTGIAPGEASAQDFAWAEQMGGPSTELARSIAVDASGNVYTTGYFSGTADFDPGPGVFTLTGGDYTHPDVFVSKLDPNGNFVWARKLGGFGADYARSIAVDGAGNVYTTGEFFNSGDFDPGPGTYTLGPPSGIFLSKLDSAGNFVWAKAFSGSSYMISGSIAVDGDGHVYSTGAFWSGTADFDPGPGVFNLSAGTGQAQVFVSKLDSGGNFVWAEQVSGWTARSIKIDDSGCVLVAGGIYNTGDFDPGAGTYLLGPKGLFILKLDSAGGFLWARQLGGDGSDVGSIAVDGGGNVYTVGYFTDTCDFDPGPGTSNLTSVGIDIFISKLDSAGDFGWAKQIGGNVNDWGYGVATDATGSLYAVGVFEKTTDFDPGPNTFDLTPASTYASFVVKLDGSGQFVWAGQMGGPASGVDLAAVAVDGQGNVVTTGSFIGTADFDPGPSTCILSSTVPHQSEPDVVVAKLAQRPTLSFSDKTTLIWSPTLSTASYNVYRSDTGLPGTFGCFASHQLDPLATDSSEPSSDALYVYLVTSVTAAGAEGSLGSIEVNGSPATERPNTKPCP